MRDQQLVNHHLWVLEFRVYDQSESGNWAAFRCLIIIHLSLSHEKPLSISVSLGFPTFLRASSSPAEESSFLAEEDLFVLALLAFVGGS